MTTRTIPADQINTAGTLAAFLKGVPPSTPIDLGAADLQHSDDGRKDPNVSQSLKLVARKLRRKRGKK